MTQENQNPQGQIVINNQTEKKSNAFGIAGFVFALIAVFLCWVPVLNWIICVLGLILSSIGLSKHPKGLAIAGFVISLIMIILLLVVTVFGVILFSI
ncbi:MAG TPA: hypothetical protein ENN33_15570 [Ignavibacteria bacterium]|nr:hypothetical protein [Ignavibacteria bacterium]